MRMRARARTGDYTYFYNSIFLLLHLLATARKRPVSLPKTTRRFIENKPSFYEK